MFLAKDLPDLSRKNPRRKLPLYVRLEQKVWYEQATNTWFVRSFFRPDMTRFVNMKLSEQSAWEFLDYFEFPLTLSADSWTPIDTKGIRNLTDLYERINHAWQDPPSDSN